MEMACEPGGNPTIFPEIVVGVSTQDKHTHKKEGVTQEDTLILQTQTQPEQLQI